MRFATRTTAARHGAAAGRARSHNSVDHASHRFRWLVHERLYPRDGGVVRSFLKGRSVAAARFAHSICGLCAVGTAALTERTRGRATRLLKGAVEGVLASAAVADRQAAPGRPN